VRRIGEARLDVGEQSAEAGAELDVLRAGLPGRCRRSVELEDAQGEVAGSRGAVTLREVSSAPAGLGPLRSDRVLHAAGQGEEEGRVVLERPRRNDGELPVVDIL